MHLTSLFSCFVDDVKVLDVAGNTVGDCLNDLVKQFPQCGEMLFDKNGTLIGYIEVYVNGESTYPEELSKPVKDGDQLYILSVVAGG